MVFTSDRGNLRLMQDNVRETNMSGEPETKVYLDRLHDLWRSNWPKDISQEPVYPLGEMLLADYLRAWAQRTPDKASIIYYGREVSFRELDGLSDAFAAWLHQNGIGKGDTVAVFLPNCPQFLVAFFGILKIGAIHVPVNPLFKAHELTYELNDTGATVILSLDALFPLVAEVKAKTALKTVLVTSMGEMLPPEPTIPLQPGLNAAPAPCPGGIDFLPALAATKNAPPKIEIQLDDVAALNYTGGTTGMPKGCVHTQRDMIYTAATTCSIGIKLKPTDVGINFYPVFWIAGEDMGIIFPIFSGATYVLLARWDPVAFMTAVQTYKATVASLLVDNAVEVMEHARVGEFDLRSLRETGQKSFHFMGESSGAIRAAAFAQATPERVRRLVLEAFTYTGRGSSTLAKRGEQTEFYRTHSRRPRDADMIRSIFTRDKPGTTDPRVPEAMAKAELPNGDSVPTGTYLDMTANLPLVDPLLISARR